LAKSRRCGVAWFSAPLRPDRTMEIGLNSETSSQIIPLVCTPSAMTSNPRAGAAALGAPRKPIRTGVSGCRRLPASASSSGTAISERWPRLPAGAARATTPRCRAKTRGRLRRGMDCSRAGRWGVGDRSHAPVGDYARTARIFVRRIHVFGGEARSDGELVAIEQELVLIVLIADEEREWSNSEPK
jgi:hypothetical protein